MSETSQITRRYNYVYDKLVKSDDDIAGMFFYYQGRMDNKQETEKPTTSVTTNQQAD